MKIGYGRVFSVQAQCHLVDNCKGFIPVELEELIKSEKNPKVFHCICLNILQADIYLWNWMGQIVYLNEIEVVNLPGGTPMRFHWRHEIISSLQIIFKIWFASTRLLPVDMCTAKKIPALLVWAE